MAVDIMRFDLVASERGANVKEVSMPVSTGGKKGSPDRKETDFQVHIPATLKDAISLEGTDQVFKRYLQSLAVAMQATKRAELGEKKTGERKRASYLEAVGL